MKIAILGTRGIPARYGGFETFAEELSRGLAGRGHELTVYCRERHSTPTYEGVKLRRVPSIRHKYFETVSHTALSTLDVIFHRQHVLLYCNGANAIFTWAPKILGMPTALNVDGLERKRKKWNVIAKLWYFMSEWLATWCPSAVVTDAEQITSYYARRYRKQTTFIPYGAPLGRVETSECLDRLGLGPRGYFLFVSRMEPENHALEVREAFEKVATDFKLALIGDAPYARDYIARVRATTDPRIVIPGAIYGLGYHELQSHSFAYIHATEVGGTHPALIEAMGRGALVLYLDTPENAEVAGGVGIPFRHGELTAKLQQVLAMSEDERNDFRRKAEDRVRDRYSWDTVISAYEQLLRGLAG